MDILNEEFVENDSELLLEDKSNNYYFNDSYKSYLKEISKFKRLTDEEEKLLFTEYKNGNMKARKKIIESNLKLVIPVAKKYYEYSKGSSYELLDFIQEGNKGLMRAVETFDLEKECKFSTYAVWWIRQYVSTYKSTSSILKSNIHIEEKVIKYTKFIFDYKVKYGVNPTLGECCNELNVNFSQLQSIINLSLMPISIDSNISNDPTNELKVSDIIADVNVDIENEIVEKIYLKSVIDIFKQILTETELCVFMSRMGIYKYYLSDPMTLEDIGKNLNVTRERIRQIEFNAIKKLKEKSNLLFSLEKLQSIYDRQKHELDETKKKLWFENKNLQHTQKLELQRKISDLSDEIKVLIKVINK